MARTWGFWTRNKLDILSASVAVRLMNGELCGQRWSFAEIARLVA